MEIKVRNIDDEILVFTELAAGRWFTLSFIQQWTTVGCDVSRAIRQKNEGNGESCTRWLASALELLDITLKDPKNKRKLPELLRIRRNVVNYFVQGKGDKVSDKAWDDYFLYFNIVYAYVREK